MKKNKQTLLSGLFLGYALHVKQSKCIPLIGDDLNKDSPRIKKPV